jgi:acetoacetyl-CoA synthetase
MFENVWRHGDWINITDHQGIIILGRSDATLNRHGVRIGTAEIYGSLNKIEEIKDSLVVNLEMEGGKHYMPLFVVLNDGQRLTPELIQKIAKQLRADYSPRHVPDEVYEVADLPYTISGKKLETPVKKILLGMAVDTVSNKDAMRNPESLEYFKSFKIPNL